MNFHEMIVRRRSIRRFTDEVISDDVLNTIIEAGLLSPSSKMSRPWHFVIVDDKRTLKLLSESRAVGANPIANCKVAIIVCADSELTGAWIEDATIAATYMQLQAQDLGLGSCWIQIRDRFDAEGKSSAKVVSDILNIPENISVECVVVLGYKGEEKKPQNTEKLLWDRVHKDKWQ